MAQKSGARFKVYFPHVILTYVCLSCLYIKAKLVLRNFILNSFLHVSLFQIQQTVYFHELYPSETGVIGHIGLRPG